MQSDEIFYDLISDWSFIGKLEHIHEDLPKMMALLDPDATALSNEIRDLSPSVTKANNKIAAFYTPELQEMVVERFRPDFDKFGYSTSIDSTG